MLLYESNFDDLSILLPAISNIIQMADLDFCDFLRSCCCMDSLKISSIRNDGFLDSKEIAQPIQATMNQFKI